MKPRCTGEVARCDDGVRRVDRQRQRLRPLVRGAGPEFDAAIRRGYAFYRAHFIRADGAARYFHDRTYPIDIQCSSQAVETLAKFADFGPDVLPLAERVANWTIDQMQDPSGYFYYRRYPLLVARIPVFHWGQATMYRALSLLLLQLEGEKGSLGKPPHG